MVRFRRWLARGWPRGGSALPETTFEVAYDGPALEGHVIPVRDLAPSLLALGDLFTEASAAVFPGHPPAALKIRATKDGSFAVDLILEAPKVWDQFVNLFSSREVTALVNLRDVIISVGGLLWIIKLVGGLPILKREDATEPGYVKLTLPDGTTLEALGAAVDLFDNLAARESARRVVEPLARKDIETVQFSSDAEESVSIHESDLPAYTVPEIEEIPLLEHEREMVVSIASAVFTQGNKWRFSDGDRLFYAAIEDEAFLEGVDRGIESFRKGDMLKCLMRIVQTRRADVLQTDHTVLEVQEHIPRQAQLRLDHGEATPDAA